MAEREGFEPSVPLQTTHTISSRAPSANSDISPHELQGPIGSPWSAKNQGKSERGLAERVGFEPTIPGKRDTAFRERGLQPLGNLSNLIPDPSQVRFNNVFATLCQRTCQPPCRVKKVDRSSLNVPALEFQANPVHFRLGSVLLFFSSSASGSGPQ